MSVIKVASDTIAMDKKSDIGPLDPVMEVNEASEVIDLPPEELQFEEIPPKIFSLFTVNEPLTIPSLNNSIYENGVINLCWPEITEPVFETRTCFPPSYYTNSSKERLLLAYAENFRRQFLMHFHMRKPLLFQAPNECGLQKMVCTSIRPTKICFEGCNTWQGLSSLVADFFDFEPLKKPMLQRAAPRRHPTPSPLPPPRGPTLKRIPDSDLLLVRILDALTHTLGPQDVNTLLVTTLEC